MRLRAVSFEPGRLIDLIADQTWRAALGRRVEEGAEIGFRVLRWAGFLGLARFLEGTAGGAGFTVLYWVIAAFLLAYLASVFLLRPEIPIFERPATRWHRAVQSAVNLVICLVLFAAVLWGVTALADAIAQHRFTVLPPSGG